MAILTYQKGIHVTLTPHFISTEFDCPCKTCKTTLIDEQLIEYLEALRGSVQSPLRINSGYRCAEYQNELRLRGYETATGRSTHEDGRAADVMRTDAQSSGIELEKLAREVGFKAVGVGHNWIHVDLRSDKERRWLYTKR